MADLYGGVPAAMPTIFQAINGHLPTPIQLLTMLALLSSGVTVLVLSGIALVAVILLTPIVLLTSPMWVPVGTVLLMATAGALSVVGFVAAAVAGVTWVYKYLRGGRPVGAARVDYARSRIADTARGYGGYFHGKVMDVAPGA